jgi:REP element-mobilizing transposase RayT
MARPLRIAYPGAYYHVTSRGNEQKDVFKSQRDREKFLEYLASATERYGAVIHAYCLMSNHYHLLLETPAGNISQIMRHINGAYTTYFNIKRKRSGHLFQGRFKAILVEVDEYATELSRYIHLNPVRSGMAKRPEDYRWSSYRSYISQNTAPEWLMMGMILGYFGNNAKEAGIKYRSFVEDMLGTEYDSPLQNIFGSTVLGSNEFIEMVTATHLNDQAVNRDVPALRQFIACPSTEEVLKAVDTVMGENRKQARQVGMHLCHKYSGGNLRELGELFNVGISAITEASRLLVKKMEKDKALKDRVKRIKGNLNICDL